MQKGSLILHKISNKQLILPKYIMLEILYFNSFDTILLIIDLLLLIVYKVKWRVAKYGDPYSNLCSAFNHPSAHTHTAVNTHTHTSSEHTHTQQWTHTHTPWGWGVAPGSSRGFGGLLKSLTSVVFKAGESAGYSLPPPTIFLPARDSNPWPSGYKSDSLSIRPRLPNTPFIVIMGYCLANFEENN